MYDIKCCLRPWMTKLAPFEASTPEWRIGHRLFVTSSMKRDILWFMANMGQYILLIKMKMSMKWTNFTLLILHHKRCKAEILTVPPHIISLFKAENICDLWWPITFKTNFEKKLKKNSPVERLFTSYLYNIRAVVQNEIKQQLKLLQIV